MTAPTVIEFSVPGVPIGQPRVKARAVGGARRFVQIYTPSERVGPWKDAVRLFFAPHQPPKPWESPVRVSMMAYFERPQRLLRASSPAGAIPHTAKPDLDNVLKAVLDALTWDPRTGRGLWRDDAFVTEYGRCGKWYVAKGCEPGIRIRCELIDQTQGGGACSS